MISKSHLFVSFFFILLISYACAQKDTDSSKNLLFTFTIGKTYKVFVKGGFEAEGTIISQDSSSIRIKTQYKIFDISRNEIIGVEGFEAPEPEPEYLTAKVLTDTTFELDIYMVNRTLYKNVRIIRSEDSSVVILKDEVKKTINLYKINKIIFHENGLAKGITLGGIIGFGIGFLLGTIAGPFSTGDGESSNFGDHLSFGTLAGIILAVPGVIVGGITGAIVGDNTQVYDMSSSKKELKLKRLRYIIEENKRRSP
jgi:hypothetical protein